MRILAIFSLVFVLAGVGSSAASAAEVDTGALNCTSGPFTDNGTISTTAQNDFVTIDADGLSIFTTVTFNVTTSASNAAVGIDDDGGVDGDYSPNQILNNGGGFQSVFTAAEAGDIVFTLSKQTPVGTWLSWTATCGGGSGGGASMTVVKTAEVDSGAIYDAVGDTVAYTVTVTNTGDENLTNLVVKESSFNGNGTAPTFNCPDTTLAPGEFVACTASYSIVQGDLDDGQVDNVAQAEVDEIETAVLSNQATVTSNSTALMTVLKSATVNGLPGNTYFVVGDLVNYTVRVTNIGGVSLSGLSVSEVTFTGNGTPPSFTCTDTTLAPSEFVDCTASYSIVEGDLDDGQVDNIAQAEVNEIDGAVVSNQVTLVYDDTIVEREVDAATRSFLFRRMDRLLSDGPDRARLLRKRADRGFAASPFNLTGSSVGAGTNLAFATSLQQVMAYNSSADAQRMQAKGRNATEALAMAQRFSSGGGGADLPAPVYEEVESTAALPSASPFDLWIEGHYTNYDSDFGDGDFGVVYVGADYLLNERLLIGLLAQFDWASQTQDSAHDIDGSGWMAGPYISVELLNNVFFDARIAWGQSDNEATVEVMDVPFGGDFDTDRWLAQAKLSGNYAAGNWRFTPEISVGYIEEKRKTFTVSNGGTEATVDGTTLALGRLTVGPEIAYRLFYGDFVLEPQLGLRLLWDFHAEGDEVAGLPVYETDPRGAIELGLGLQSASGWSGRFGVKYDGVGTGGDLNAYSINGWLNIPF